MTTSIESAAIPPWDMADRLRKSLREADIGVQEMADYLGVSRNTVSGWINGRVPPNPDALPRWAELTGFPLRWITDGDGPGPSPSGPSGAGIRRHPKARAVQLRVISTVGPEMPEVSDEAQAYVDLAEGLPRVDSNHQPSEPWFDYELAAA